MAARHRELRFSSWEVEEVVGKLPATRLVNFQGIILKSECFLVFYCRYSHSLVLLDGVVYVFGGASSGDDGTSIYHGDLFSLYGKYDVMRWMTTGLRALY